MRLALLMFAVSATIARAQSPPDDKTEVARAIESAIQTRQTAESYTIRVERPGGQVRLNLEPKTLLQWSNPIAGSYHGSVFVWTENGRPAVIASIYKKFVPPRRIGLEFQTLAADRVTAERAGHPEWLPSAGSPEAVPVPGAPVPAETASQRLRQMRAIARDFNATRTDRKDNTQSLRLLTQPIYRYNSSDSNVLDGAIFAFVEATDPEVFLLIEAGRSERGPVWRYVPARMNSVALHLAHKGREVWSVSAIQWQKARDPSGPYALIIIEPGEVGYPLDDSSKP